MKRVVHCSHCGTALQIPAETPAGKKARCGSCAAVFVIAAPEPIVAAPPVAAPAAPQKRERTPTTAGVFRIEDLPPELRSLMASMPEPEDAPAPTRAPSPMRGRSRSTLMKSAFDVSRDGNSEVTRTGAKVVEIDGDGRETS
ncbi:MAG: hypothetical protein IV100_13820 [Myxococcales bacterium]|nr:hypothetical protein [Myxococcales bacterium]